MTTASIHSDLAFERCDAPFQPSVAPETQWGFAAFILLNAAFFLRPAEVLGLYDWSIYEYLMIACALISAPVLLRQLSPKFLAACPITAFVVAMLVLIAISRLPSIDESAAAAGVFAKVVLYFALLVGLVSSQRRLRLFMVWLAVFIVVLGTLPVLQYHHFLNILALEPISDTGWDPIAKTEIHILRLVGPGVFHDPNDLCHLLSVGAVLCIYAYGLRPGIPWRLAWIVMLAGTIYAMLLTQSRGGLIALLAGIMALIWHRIGWRKALGLTFGLAAAVLLLRGRQTDFSATSGTGQDRVQLWSSALILFRLHPLLGVGQGNLSPLIGHVAHNSFIQCYAELGWLGGTVFLGAFAVSIAWLRPAMVDSMEPELVRMRGYLFAVVIAYIAGMLSLTHSYEVVPYMVMGLAVAFHRIASPEFIEMHWVSGRFLLQMAALSTVFLIAAHIFVRLTFRG